MDEDTAQRMFSFFAIPMVIFIIFVDLNADRMKKTIGFILLLFMLFVDGMNAQLRITIRRIMPVLLASRH